MPAGNVGAVLAANRRAKARSGRGTATGGYPGPRPLSQLSIRIPEAKQTRPAEPPVRMSNADVVSYLESFGYFASDLEQWDTLASAPRPKLTFTMLDHREIDGHTYYGVKCHLLVRRGASVEWHKQRRLLHLRDGIHDMVRKHFGEDYDSMFGEARFARRGGLPGTTTRLQAWLQQLAECVHSGTVPPVLVARVLQFFEAPKPTFAVTLKDADPVPSSKASVNAPIEVLPTAAEPTHHEFAAAHVASSPYPVFEVPTAPKTDREVESSEVAPTSCSALTTCQALGTADDLSQQEHHNYPVFGGC